MEIRGKICGVKITERNDAGPLMQLLIEDDGNWIEKDFQIDSFWLDDLIFVLSQAKLTDIVRHGNQRTIEKIKKAYRGP